MIFYPFVFVVFTGYIVFSAAQHDWYAAAMAASVLIFAIRSLFTTRENMHWKRNYADLYKAKVAIEQKYLEAASEGIARDLILSIFVEELGEREIARVIKKTTDICVYEDNHNDTSC